jgi:hypothetical protein
VKFEGSCCVIALVAQWAQRLGQSDLESAAWRRERTLSRDLPGSVGCGESMRSVEKSWDSISEVEWVRPGSELLGVDQYMFLTTKDRRRLVSELYFSLIVAYTVQIAAPTEGSRGLRDTWL